MLLHGTQDTVFGGRIRVDAARKEIEYRCVLATGQQCVLLPLPLSRLSDDLHVIAHSIDSGWSEKPGTLLECCLLATFLKRLRLTWRACHCRKRLRLGNGMIGATVRGSYAGVQTASVCFAGHPAVPTGTVWHPVCVDRIT